MSKLSEHIKIKGRLHIRVWNKDGDLIADYDAGENTVTDFGDAWVADQLSDRTYDLIGYMAIGTGTNAGDDTELTELVSQLGSRVALTSTTQGTGADDNTVIYVASFTGYSGTVKEAGLFVTSNTATLCFYNDSLNQTIGSDDTLQITWTPRFGAS